ncbi:MAG: hypothetical protein WBB39_00540 [Candidatus Saccharimonadales bacterium]
MNNVSILNSLLVTGLFTYIALFSYETLQSWRRLRLGRETYPHITWEISHTLLVIVFTIFVITYGVFLPRIAYEAFIPLLVAATGFLVKAGFQLHIFFVRSSSIGHGVIDWLFALTHIIILVSLLVTGFSAISFVIRVGALPDTSMLEWFIPGLFIGIAIVAAPIFYLVRAKYFV